MAGAPNVFNVEFGFNGTQLTELLENGKYREAESLIETHAHTSYLDEGSYQRIPLYIVLSGDNPRNFRIASQLIQGGANVNLRIPEILYGCEYVGPGLTALENLVRLYIKVTDKVNCKWNYKNEPVLGLNGDLICEEEELLDQILELTLMLLNHGADPNIPCFFEKTPFHNAVRDTSNPRLMELLYEHSAVNLEAVNCEGNTCLNMLCDPFPDGVEGYLANHDDDDPYQVAVDHRGTEYTWNYLLGLRDLPIDKPNHHSRTPFFNCILRGDTKHALTLIRYGCDTSVRAQVRDRKIQRKISALFGSILSTRVIKSHRHKYIANEPPPLGFMAHLVDLGHFDDFKITEEVYEFMEDYSEDLKPLRSLDADIIHLMFGGTSSTLRQKCARTILQNCLLKPNDRMLELVYDVTKRGFQSRADEFYTNYIMHEPTMENPALFEEFVVGYVNTHVLEHLIDVLDLPKDNIWMFEVELLRQRMCSVIRQFTWFRYYDAEYDDSSRASDVGSLDSSDLNDSDLEYW